MRNKGVPASPSGHSAEPEPISVVSAPRASVPNAVAACFEFAGQAIVMLAFAFAIILAAPFMLLGRVIARAGADL